MYELTGCITVSDLRNAFNQHVVVMCTEAWSVLTSFCRRVFANWMETRLLPQGSHLPQYNF